MDRNGVFGMTPRKRGGSCTPYLRVSRGLRKRFHVATCAKDIVSAVQQHRVVVLVGETGSGKTTQAGQQRTMLQRWRGTMEVHVEKDFGEVTRRGTAFPARSRSMERCHLSNTAASNCGHQCIGLSVETWKRCSAKVAHRVASEIGCDIGGSVQIYT